MKGKLIEIIKLFKFREDNIVLMIFRKKLYKESNMNTLSYLRISSHRKTYALFNFLLQNLASHRG